MTRDSCDKDQIRYVIAGDNNSIIIIIHNNNNNNSNSNTKNDLTNKWVTMMNIEGLPKG